MIIYTTISLFFNCIHPLRKKKRDRLRQYVTQARLTGRHPQWIQLQAERRCQAFHNTQQQCFQTQASQYPQA